MTSGPSDVERRFVAELHFFIHLLFDFVHRNVAGAFDHDLHVILPGLSGQLAQRFQLGELGFIAGVGNATGTQAIAERVADVILRQNLVDVVEALVEEVLLVVVAIHCARMAPPRLTMPVMRLETMRDILNQHAGMDGHVVHALLRPALR